MGLTPDVLSLLQSHEFQTVLRVQVKSELEIQSVRRKQKYKAARLALAVFCGVTLATMIAGLMIDVCERWLVVPKNGEL